MRETKLWTWHIITGCVILAFLGLHMVIAHMDGVIGVFNPKADGEAIAWQNVTYRSQQAVFAFIYIILLGAALYHGLYGLRTIIFELSPPAGIRHLVTGGFWAGGILLFIYGSYVAVVLGFIR